MDVSKHSTETGEGATRILNVAVNSCETGGLLFKIGEWLGRCRFLLNRIIVVEKLIPHFFMYPIEAVAGNKKSYILFRD
jgi:hypothetical protein